MRDADVVLIPIDRPLPDVTGHVEQAVPVWRERSHRSRPLIPVFAKVLPGKFTLPRIRHPAAFWLVLVTPAKLRSVQAAARGKFPFGFRWQALAGPRGIRF